MIPFFPTPYPDELWYSVICRYHIRSGNPSVKYSIRELYGANHINVPVELCGALSPLLDALPTKDLTAKDIIMQHTLYPYYTRFFSMCVLNVTNVFDVGQLGNVVYPIVAFATTLLLVREKPIAVMAWTATVLIAQIVIDLLVNTILIVITGQDDLLLELNLQRSPGFLAICLLVKLCDIIFFIFVTRKRISTPISDKIILRFLLLPVLSAIIGMVMVNEMSQGKASGGLFLLLIFFMILCDIIAVDLMFATSKSVKQVVEAESKVKINEISKTQYLRLAEKSDTIRTWKHDTREAMNGALLLMQQGRTAEAELLLKDRLASMQVETIAIKSGNI